MSESTETLDLAQRVVNALTRTTQPKVVYGMEDFDSETETRLGEVPNHLRHLVNLYSEMYDEAKVIHNEAEAILEEDPDEGNQQIATAMRLVKDADIVADLLHCSLATYIESAPEEFNKRRICSDWVVAGSKVESKAESCVRVTVVRIP